MSLVEVLLSLLITMVVMGLVIQTSQNLAAIYQSQSRSVEASSAVTRAFADIINEEARAGCGIGEGGRRGARVVKLREVRFYLQPERDGNVLFKQVVGAGATTRTLVRRVETLRFEYLDGSGNKIAAASLEDSPGRRLVVKITMRTAMGTERDEVMTLATAVALDAQSMSVDFAEQGYGFRLARIFHPIEHAAGVAGRRFADWGVIVSAGQNPTRDRSYLYTHRNGSEVAEAVG